jgi:hypothetical protein
MWNDYTVLELVDMLNTIHECLMLECQATDQQIRLIWKLEAENKRLKERLNAQEKREV